MSISDHLFILKRICGFLLNISIINVFDNVSDMDLHVFFFDKLVSHQIDVFSWLDIYICQKANMNLSFQRNCEGSCNYPSSINFFIHYQKTPNRLGFGVRYTIYIYIEFGILSFQKYENIQGVFNRTRYDRAWSLF